MKARGRANLWREIAGELEGAGGGLSDAGRAEGRRGQGTGREGADGFAGWDVLFSVLEDLPVCEPPAGKAELTAARLSLLPLPGAFRRRMLAALPVRPRGLGSALAAVRSQTRIFSPGFWATVTAAMLGAVGVGLALLGAGTRAGGFLSPPARLALPVAVVSPVAAILGVSHSLRSFGRGPWEVELSCPITPVGMAIGRLVIVLAHVSGSALLATVILWTAGGGQDVGTLWSVVASWLAPVLFNALLSFYLSLRLSPLAGGVAPLGLWVVQIALRQWKASLSLLTLPGHPGLAGAPLILAVLTGLLLVASVRVATRAAEYAGRVAA